jgi:hypothetical protein
MPKAAAGPAEIGNLQFLDPDVAAGVERRCQHLALVRGGEHQTVVDCAGPNPRRSTNCFLPPPTPSLQSFFTGRVAGKFDQHCRRLDVFVLTATGRDQQGRQAQWKQ